MHFPMICRYNNCCCFFLTLAITSVFKYLPVSPQINLLTRCVAGYKMFFMFFNRSSKISRRWSLDNLSPDSRREGYVRDLRARHRAQQLGQRDEGYPFMLSERNKQAAAVTVAATSGSGGSVSRQRHFLCILNPSFLSKAAIYNQCFLFLAFENLHQVSDHSIWHVCHNDRGICLNLLKKQIFVLPLITTI